LNSNNYRLNIGGLNFFVQDILFQCGNDMFDILNVWCWYYEEGEIEIDVEN